MDIGHAQITSDIANQASWHVDWLWGLPLIISTVLFHVTCFVLISRRVDTITARPIVDRHPASTFMLLMGTVTLLATAMHALEALIWSGAYRLLGALPDVKLAMLYSLNAMTSYGHEDLHLQNHWRLMGAIEALNGWLLFGLTTAFLFSMIVRLRASHDLQRHTDRLPLRPPK